MKALATRLRRLEGQFVQPDYVENPRKHLRIVVCRIGRKAGLKEATCKRTLGDGFLMEIVRLQGSRENITDQELDRFVATFPVTILGPGDMLR